MVEVSYFLKIIEDILGFEINDNIRDYIFLKIANFTNNKLFLNNCNELNIFENKEEINLLNYFNNNIKKNKLNKFLKIDKLIEFAKLFNESIEPRKDYILSPEDYYNYIKGKFPSYRETVILTLLNQKNRIISDSIVAIGSDKITYISIREIIVEISNYKASSIILAHNHPSGDIKPSDADIEFTRNLKRILDIIQVNFLDHIIIGDNFCSLRREGYI
jgi:DNA repair protein RadC